MTTALHDLDDRVLRLRQQPDASRLRWAVPLAALAAVVVVTAVQPYVGAVLAVLLAGALLAYDVHLERLQHHRLLHVEHVELTDDTFDHISAGVTVVAAITVAVVAFATASFAWIVLSTALFVAVWFGVQLVRRGTEAR